MSMNVYARANVFPCFALSCSVCWLWLTPNVDCFSSAALMASMLLASVSEHAVIDEWNRWRWMKLLLVVLICKPTASLSNGWVCFINFLCWKLLDPEVGSPNATVVVVVLLLGISSLKISKAFLICSGAQRNCVHICAHIPYRSAVSDFQIDF